MMIKILVLFISITSIAGDSYLCPSANGNFQNEYDYRSYYVCTNHCDRLEYCFNATGYYSSVDRTCKDDGHVWTPAYNLTGVEEVIPYVQYRHIRQSGFDLSWSSETNNHMFAFVGRYIHETAVVGTETILSLKNRCVLIRDVKLTVKKSKSFCMTNIENPYSMKCELPRDYDFSKCATY